MGTYVKIEINKLVFPEQEKPALQNIDFEINLGDFIVITGDVASGKSTLLHTITGAIPHFHNAEMNGRVTIMGRDIRDLRLNEMSDYAGYMMQDPLNQIIGLNVYEDVAFGLENRELPIEKIDETVSDVLEFVGLKGYENSLTSSLSGGQAQRVVLAAVLALNAPILILDQPTAELDPQGRYEVYQRLGKLNRNKNLTIVMVMDRMEEVLNFANRVIILKEGEIVKECSPKEYYKDRVKHLNFTGRNKSATQHYHESNKPKETIAKLANVSYLYKNKFMGCEDINLQVYKGDFLSIVGLNGSGKSTIAKLLIGLLKPTKGEIQLFGQPLVKENLAKTRTHVGFLFQNPDHQIFASTLGEEVGFSLKLREEPSGTITQKIDECLKFVGLLDYKEMHPQRLSRGQRQLLALASVLADDPEFIIADEPTSGLDENQGYFIMDKLFDLSKYGKSILLITHDLTMAEIYSNRLVVLHNQRIKMDIPTIDLKEHLEQLKHIGLNFQNTISWGEVHYGDS